MQCLDQAYTMSIQLKIVTLLRYSVVDWPIYIHGSLPKCLFNSEGIYRWLFCCWLPHIHVHIHVPFRYIDVRVDRELSKKSVGIMVGIYGKFLQQPSEVWGETTGWSLQDLQTTPIHVLQFVYADWLIISKKLLQQVTFTVSIQYLMYGERWTL